MKFWSLIMQLFFSRRFVGSLAGSSYVVPTSADCIESLMRDEMMGTAEAAETCCGK